MGTDFECHKGTAEEQASGAGVDRSSAAIAHDINDLLMVILGCSDMALTYVGPDGRARPYLEDVRRSALRCAGLVSELVKAKDAL